MSTLVKDEDQGYLLVKRKEKIIAYYPITKLNLLKGKFKDKELCSTPEFSEYESLDDFVNSIYFFEFFEYFLDHLHKSFPIEISYEKYKTNTESVIIKDDYFLKINTSICSG